MLTSNDVGEFFQEMRSNYGAIWKHGAEDIPRWRRKLSKFDRKDLMSLADTCIGPHPKIPPKIGECLALLEPKKSPNTYSRPTDMAPVMSAANRVLMKVLLDVGGVDSAQLQTMVSLKNALVEDNGDRGICEQFIDQLLSELTANASSSDVAKKNGDTKIAIDAFRGRQGMRHVAEMPGQ